MLAIARLLGFTIGASLSGLIFRFVGQNAEIAALVLGAILAACASAISLLRLKKQHAEASPASGEQDESAGWRRLRGKAQGLSAFGRRLMPGNDQTISRGMLAAAGNMMGWS